MVRTEPILFVSTRPQIENFKYGHEFVFKTSNHHNKLSVHRGKIFPRCPRRQEPGALGSPGLHYEYET